MPHHAESSGGQGFMSRPFARRFALALVVTCAVGCAASGQIDPTGAAVIDFTDDHNDYDGHTYVARQISGPTINGDGKSSVPNAGAPPAAQSGPLPLAANVGGEAGSQVTDFAQDVVDALLVRGQILPVTVGQADLRPVPGAAESISASDDRQLKAARQLLSGTLAGHVTRLADQLGTLLALLEAGIDFTEEDISFIGDDPLRAGIGDLATQMNQLNSGMWYVNIHTSGTGGFPEGEIRGQILPVPEPSTLVLGALGLGGLVVWRVRRRAF